MQDGAKAQLQMVWPQHLLTSPPIVSVCPGYILRTYKHGDEPGFYNVMALAGWPGWNDETLRPWMARIVPESWFMATHEGGGGLSRQQWGCMTIPRRTHSAESLAGWLGIPPMQEKAWGGPCRRQLQRG